jgi:[ribosomal protein S5]-alanine N-acetyltransferase
MKPTDILITKRLVLRPLRLSDALTIQRTFPRWHTVRFLSSLPWPYPKNGALQFLRKLALPGMKDGTHWLWAITLKGGNDELKGIMHLRNGKTNRGFWIVPELRGQGLITEATTAVNQFAFEKAGFKKLVVENAKSNPASRRIKEKTGGKFMGYTTGGFVIGKRPAETWVLTKEEWIKRQSIFDT